MRAELRRIRQYRAAIKSLTYAVDNYLIQMFHLLRDEVTTKESIENLTKLLKESNVFAKRTITYRCKFKNKIKMSKKLRRRYY